MHAQKPENQNHSHAIWGIQELAHCSLHRRSLICTLQESEARSLFVIAVAAQIALALFEKLLRRLRTSSLTICLLLCSEGCRHSCTVKSRLKCVLALKLQVLPFACIRTCTVPFKPSVFRPTLVQLHLLSESHVCSASAIATVCNNASRTRSKQRPGSLPAGLDWPAAHCTLKMLTRITYRTCWHTPCIGAHGCAHTHDTLHRQCAVSTACSIYWCVCRRRHESIRRARRRVPAVNVQSHTCVHVAIAGSLTVESELQLIFLT